MKLLHWSAEPLTGLRSCQQDHDGAMKPQGLWVSDESTDWGWHAWATDEKFHLEALAYATAIHLVADHRVAILRSGADIRRWTDNYGMGMPGTDALPWPMRQGMCIDWACVAQDYQGIIITPYQWTMRLSDGCFWYYAWDCASGCIWDIDAIASWEPSMPSGFHRASVEEDA